MLTAAGALTHPASAAPWPLVTAELARMDLAALTGIAPPRTTGADAETTGKRSGRAEVSRPVHAPREPLDADVVTRVGDWLDRSEQDFQNVVMRRLSTPAADPARPSATAGAAEASIAASLAGVMQQTGEALQATRTRLATLGEDLQRRADRARGVVVAQAGKTASGGGSPPRTPSSQIDDALAPVTDWLEKSAQDFQSIIMRRLTVPSDKGLLPIPAASAVEAKKALPQQNAPEPKSAEKSAPPPAAVQPSSGGKGIAERMGEAAQSAKDWLTQSKRDFQDGVVGKLSKPGEPAAAQPVPEAQPRTADDGARRKADDDARAARQAVDAAERKVRELRAGEAKAKAKSETETAAAKAAAAAQEADAEAQRRKAALEEAARRVAAEQKKAEEAAALTARSKADEEARRKAAEQKAVQQKAAEQKAAADQKAARLAQEEAQRKADEARKKAEDDAKSAARQKEDAARLAAAASAAADKIMEKARKEPPPAGAMGVAGPPPAAAVKSSQAKEAKKAETRKDQTPPPAAAVSARAQAGAAAKDKTAGRRGSGSCRAAGKHVKPPAVYVVKRGDSLWVISRRHYHRGTRWVAIHKANDDRIANPDLIFPCQHFYIPKL